jgi:hypothetical protein
LLHQSRAPHTISGHGTMVDLTVFIAMASATAREMPSSAGIVAILSPLLRVFLIRHP